MLARCSDLRDRRCGDGSLGNESQLSKNRGEGGRCGEGRMTDSGGYSSAPGARRRGGGRLAGTHHDGRFDGRAASHTSTSWPRSWRASGAGPGGAVALRQEGLWSWTGNGGASVTRCPRAGRQIYQIPCCGTVLEELAAECCASWRPVRDFDGWKQVLSSNPRSGRAPHPPAVAALDVEFTTPIFRASHT